MNAITLLKQDHGNVEALFKQLEALDPGAPTADKRALTDQVITQLGVHAEIEEQVLYPALRERLEAPGPVLEALEEHHLTKLALWELERFPAGTDRFDAKVAVLMANVRHHVEEEEKELFEQLRTLFKPNELEAMGQRMEDLKAVVPTRPHPFAPDVPPFNVLIGLPVAVVDRVITTGRQLVDRVRQRAA